MKKNFASAVVLLLLLAIPVQAANNNAGTGQNGTGSNQGSTTGTRLVVSIQPTVNQVKNQNQIKTQNEGEDTQIQVNNQEEESLGKEEAPRNATATENMSTVAQKVEELLTNDTMPEGIGQQVKQIAQDQKNTQSEMKSELDKIDGRSGLLKKIIGPDYKALKNMEKLMDMNQLRIQQLEQLRNQLSNEGDITQVQEMIKVLTEQNTALLDRVNLELKSNGFFGWLLKLFAK